MLDDVALGEYKIFEFQDERLHNQKIKTDDLKGLLDTWVYLNDESSNTHGIVKFCKKNNYFYQLVICNDESDGLYSIDTLSVMKIFDKNKKCEAIAVYPVYFDLKLPIIRNDIKKEIEALEKLKTMQIISDNEMKFIKLLKNSTIHNNIFTKGMTKIHASIDPSIIKMIIRSKGV